jgi:hypothetical protein
MFWAGREMLAVERAAGSPEQVEPVDDAILITDSALEAVKPTTIIHIVHLTAKGSLLVENDSAEVIDRLERGTNNLAAAGFVINTDLAQLIRRVEDEQQLMILGVPIGALQLLVLCWFALYLAIKYTGDERRPDIGLLKLRGTRRPRIWLLLTGQSGVPMLLGAVAGVVGGSAAGRYFGGEITRAESTRLAAVLAVSAAAMAMLGAFVAALVAERRSLAAPVVDLLRQVPARRRAWRDVADLVIVAIAVAALFQVEGPISAAPVPSGAGPGQPGAASGLALVAPGLVALAVALVVARLTTRLATTAGTEALRSGRPVVALTAIYLARRPGVPRLCALLVVAVALLGTSVLTWDAGTRAAELRAGLELGAQRVLTVQADNRSHLLEAVRAADPEGRYAMAAAEFTGSDRVLLVDSPRLAKVAEWHAEYGAPTAARAAQLLRGNVTPAPPTRVAGAAITVDLTQTGVRTLPGSTVRRPYLQVTMAGERGRRIVGQAGPLAEGRQTVRIPVPDCVRPPHCRLVSFSYVGTANGVTYVTMLPGATLTLHRMGTLDRIDQAEPAASLLDAAAFADRSRWRPTAGVPPPSLVFGPAGVSDGVAADGLRATVSSDLSSGQRRDNAVYTMDSPSPVPVLRAGPIEIDTIAGDGRIRLFQTTVPIDVVATASLLPRLGETGTIADLEYADRLGADFGGAESMQVWLTPDAPASVLTRLSGQGIQIGLDRTLDDAVSGYLRQAPPVALRFQLGSALIGLLLAAGAVAVVAAVERRSRVAELAALRAQGASVRLVRRAAAGGHLVLLAVSVFAGVATALAVRAYAGELIPFFADGWALLAPGPLPRADLMALAVGAVAVTLGGAGLLATSQLVRKVR